MIQQFWRRGRAITAILAMGALATACGSILGIDDVTEIQPGAGGASAAGSSSKATGTGPSTSAGGKGGSSSATDVASSSATDVASSSATDVASSSASSG